MENKDEPATQEFTISRVFDAPRSLVFQAHTEAQHLAKWWGPKGYEMLVAKLDMRPGGLFHYRMRSPEGHEMWGRFVYREIVAPERIVFVSSFSDGNAGIIRAPFAPDWPLEVLNVMTLTESGGKTTLTLHGRPINASTAEISRFTSFHDSMTQGFGGTLDQLADYLKTL